MARTALDSGTLALYRPPEGPGAQEGTNIERWATMQDPLVYKVPYTAGYEPYVVLSVADVPWFDERFVDYGGGLSAWFTHLAASNFTFAVHPYGFVVHVPHARAPAASQYVEAQTRQRHVRMMALQREVEAKVVQGGYEPVVRGCESGVRVEKERSPEHLLGTGPGTGAVAAAAAAAESEGEAVGTSEAPPFDLSGIAEIEADEVDAMA